MVLADVFLGRWPFFLCVWNWRILPAMLLRGFAVVVTIMLAIDLLLQGVSTCHDHENRLRPGRWFADAVVTV